MSRIKGAAKFRKLLKQLPDAVSDEIRGELTIAGRDIAAAMRGRAPVRTGALKAGISYRVLPKTLKLLVGLLGTPTGRAKLFYGRVQDLGRKPQAVSVRRLVPGGRAIWSARAAAGTARFSTKPRGLVSTYTMNVRGMKGKRFVTGRYTELRMRLRDDLSGVWNRAIGRASPTGGR